MLIRTHITTQRAAIRKSVLQCDAVCCSVLQCVAVQFAQEPSVKLRIRAYTPSTIGESALESGTECCRAVCCIVLQCVSVF